MIDWNVINLSQVFYHIHWHLYNWINGLSLLRTPFDKFIFYQIRESLYTILQNRTLYISHNIFFSIETTWHRYQWDSRSNEYVLILNISILFIVCQSIDIMFQALSLPFSRGLSSLTCNNLKFKADINFFFSFFACVLHKHRSKVYNSL